MLLPGRRAVRIGSQDAPACTVVAFAVRVLSRSFPRSSNAPFSGTAVAILHATAHVRLPGSCSRLSVPPGAVRTAQPGKPSVRGTPAVRGTPPSGLRRT
jgi:hypothetical protein